MRHEFERVGKELRREQSTPMDVLIGNFEEYDDLQFADLHSEFSNLVVDWVADIEKSEGDEINRQRVFAGPVFPIEELLVETPSQFEGVSLGLHVIDFKKGNQDAHGVRQLSLIAVDTEKHRQYSAEHDMQQKEPLAIISLIDIAKRLKNNSLEINTENLSRGFTGNELFYDRQHPIVKRLLCVVGDATKQSYDLQKPAAPSQPESTERKGFLSRFTSKRI